MLLNPDSAGDHLTRVGLDEAWFVPANNHTRPVHYAIIKTNNRGKKGTPIDLNLNDPNDRFVSFGITSFVIQN